MAQLTDSINYGDLQITGNTNTIGSSTIGGQSFCEGTVIIDSKNVGNWNEGLRVNKTSNNWATITMGGPAKSVSSTGQGIWSIHVDTTSNFAICHAASSGTAAGCLYLKTNNTMSYNGDFTATRVYNAVFNDYAECFDNKELDYTKHKNKIVELDEDGYTVLASENSRKVIGIVSDSYGMLLGGTPTDILDNKKIPIGLVGTLYVDTLCTVSKRDIGAFAISSGGGYSKPSTSPECGTSVGKIIGIDEINNRYKVLLCLA